MESLNKLTDNEQYVQQKAIVARAINTDVSKGGDVHLMDIDYEAFKKSKEEKAQLRDMKYAWKEEMRAKHGPTWTKRSRM